jgi:hypothetical protein
MTRRHSAQLRAEGVQPIIGRGRQALVRGVRDAESAAYRTVDLSRITSALARRDLAAQGANFSHP